MPGRLGSHTSVGLIVGAILLTGASAVTADSVKLDVVYVPTPPEVVDRMMDMGKVDRAKFVVDLGSGDGRIAVAAAKRGARALGVDIDPERVNEANERAKREGVAERVEFRVENLYSTDISKADVLTLYLLEEINLNLRPKILSDLRPGALVVSHAFHMGDWKADEHSTVNGRPVYVWTVPAKAAGRWQVAAGERAFTLNFEQKFQQVSGTADIGRRSVPVQQATLLGDAISFVVEMDGRRFTFRGKVNGNEIAGTGELGAWKATKL
jgi:SAM-dependent methyltransferase